ncbi:unnamed protein product [Rotaria sp. Silwood2]|nr:unnamed protein product [Rotaria sp. Silwood2]CAF3323926.1 unnamed protein product [Rotaria sp. Silwood2]CAF4351152.1 unnamed protein product [Rotaria sp. Silwood2]CAF4439085.1 unnamed protein product [Rotaria sp. Silwood2]
MNSAVKNRRVDRISILLQEYNIEKIIHIKGQNNGLADYLSRHSIQHNEEIFDEDYGIIVQKKPGRLSSIPTLDEPFQLIGIDYCDPFKPTPRGNQYVLCITDCFTRWITAIALPDCSAQTTAQALLNNYICQYGVPLTILSDQGNHFKNQLMESMAKLIAYNHSFSSVYHSHSNGMIESFNATFVSQIAKLQDRENNNWDEFLSPVTFAYNTGAHVTTNYLPFQLQFGREPRIPTDEPSSSFIFNKPNDYYVLAWNIIISMSDQHLQYHLQQQYPPFTIPTSNYKVVHVNK